MSEQLAAVQQENIISRAADRVAAVGEHIGDAVVDTIAEHPGAVAKVLGGIGVVAGAMGIAPNVASAETSPQGINFSELSSDTTVLVGQSHMTASAFSRETVMANDRTISKAKINELKANGDCQVFNGKKVKIYTQGHVEGGGVAPGRDHRKSLFCQDSSGNWYRAACGNEAEINVTPPHAIENVIWENGKLKFKVVTMASAAAEAMCTTADGLVSASAYGHGSGYAAAKLKIHNGSKSVAKGGNSELISKTILEASAQAKSKAGASAVAICIERGGTVVVPPTKNGEQGAGNGIPTQPGGPGTPGQPGNSGEGTPCYDDNSSTNGDTNPATPANPLQPEILYGTDVDQFGVCVGPAQAMRNA